MTPINKIFGFVLSLEVSQSSIYWMFSLTVTATELLVCDVVSLIWQLHFRSGANWSVGAEFSIP